MPTKTGPENFCDCEMLGSNVEMWWRKLKEQSIDRSAMKWNGNPPSASRRGKIIAERKCKSWRSSAHIGVHSIALHSSTYSTLLCKYISCGFFGRVVRLLLAGDCLLETIVATRTDGGWSTEWTFIQASQSVSQCGTLYWIRGSTAMLQQEET